MNQKKIRIQLPAHINFAASVRHLANSVFEMAGFNPEWAARMELVVDELFMNAVTYGSDEESQIYVHFNYNSNEVNFEIHDEGKGENKITPEDIKAIIQKNAADKNIAKTSGRGLALIVSLWTDKFDLARSQHGGMAISFSKKMTENLLSPTKNVEDQENKKSERFNLPKPHTFVPAHLEAEEGFTIKLENKTSLQAIEKLDKEIRKKIQLLRPSKVLALDLEEVTYINSILIGYLISWYNNIQPKGGYFILKNIKSSVKDILHLVGLHQIFSLDN